MGIVRRALHVFLVSLVAIAVWNFVMLAAQGAWSAAGLPAIVPMQAFTLAAIALIGAYTLAYPGSVPWLPRRRSGSDRLNLVLLGGALALPLLLRLAGGDDDPVLGRPAHSIQTTIAVPFIEEFYFRGAVWKLLQRADDGERSSMVPLIVCAILFALVHSIFFPMLMRGHVLPMEPASFAYFAAWGLAFGLLRWRFGGVLVPMGVHTWNNALV